VKAYERGLYEELISEALERELGDLPTNLVPLRSALRGAEAGDRLALFLARIVERAVDDLAEKERVKRGLALARALVATLAGELGREELRHEAPVQEDPILRAVLARRPDGSPESIEAPLIPLLDTTLLTNAPGEPRVGHQLLTEIASADRIDVVMAFIRRSGIRPLLDALRRHCERGRSLRVLTTTYTGSTEPEALQMLQTAGAEVRISYDTTSTRLHAKAWLFHRSGGLATAYVGSSNLTHSAQVSGLEWNVRASGARNPDLVAKIAAVFEAYWEGGDFVPFVGSEFALRSAAMKPTSRSLLSPVEIRLEPFQERLLEEIEVARERGRHRNLLVSATGTGKTVMAAVDYARVRDRLGRSRLLFVAHRQELLEQSRATYAQALREPGFGELWVGGERPERWDHVFASIQSLSRSGLESLAADHFDVVVIDEFHHAAARSYRELLDHVAPRELLGLTATPERADALPILDWFDGSIAAELRLWDAIDQGRLVPFEYYGIHDGVDLREIPWKRGSGYDVDALSNLYTGNDAWARLVLGQIEKHVDDLRAMRALGFCVNVEHARFMARIFQNAGLSSTAVWGDSPEDERRAALEGLRRREINVLFSVDLFNEGIDLPNLDTLLLLRPTDSPTLFLQQLGRGLRKHHGKASCLVLDFVGQHRREFRFDRRFQALLGGSRKHVERQVEAGFPFLPAGCHMELEHRAQEIILDSIRRAVPSQWTAKALELRRLSEEGRGSLRTFLEDSGLALEDVYVGAKGWSDLREAAGLQVETRGPDEETLRRACGRLLHVDDRERLESYGDLLRSTSPPRIGDVTSRSARLLRMLVASVCDQALTKDGSLEAGIALLWQHPQVRSELVELFDLLRDRIGHRHYEIGEPHTEVPLRIHARYSRLEILAAFRPEPRAKVPAWQTGVYWASEARTDLFAFTLDKTSGQFSPTTRYRDYAISPELIHWESQSATRADSETGRRYQEHVRAGSSVMLFARERADDRAFWFLGPATYVRHEGELPMAITWRLRHPLPGDLYASFAAAVA
jgi:superfamily II DNA or RNA helicase/HKD family nuclease